MVEARAEAAEDGEQRQDEVHRLRPAEGQADDRAVDGRDDDDEHEPHRRRALGHERRQAHGA